MANKTRLPLNFKEIKSKSLKAGVVYALRTYSFYDEEKEERKILKTDASGRQLEKLLKDGNRNNISKTLTTLKDSGMIIERGKYYIIPDLPKDVSYRDISTDFMKQLLQKRNSAYIMVYLWLHRRYYTRIQKGQEPLFSIGDILRQVFQVYSRSQNSYNRVTSILAEMVNDGVLAFGTVRVGRTFLRKIYGLSECFASEAVLKMIIENQTKNIDDDYVDTDTEEFENVEIEEEHPVIMSPVYFHLLGSNKDYTFDEIKDELEFRTREWVEENFYALPENRELIYTSGLDEVFPQFFGF